MLFPVIAEISLYPLTEAYPERILDFVRRLRAYPEIEVTVGETASVVRGDYSLIMDILKAEIAQEFREDGKVGVVLKILNLK